MLRKLIMRLLFAIPAISVAFLCSPVNASGGVILHLPDVLEFASEWEDQALPHLDLGWEPTDWSSNFKSVNNWNSVCKPTPRSESERLNNELHVNQPPIAAKDSSATPKNAVEGPPAHAASSAEGEESSSPLQSFDPVPRARLLRKRSATDSPGLMKFGLWVATLSLVSIGCIGSWLLKGVLRAYPGQCFRLQNCKGREEIVVGPCLAFRPWPFYTRHPFVVGPRHCLVESVQPLTADGFRADLSVHVLFSVANPKSLAARQDPEVLIAPMARSAFSKCTGEIELSTFVARQHSLCDRVAGSLQLSLETWGIKIHSVEISRVGSIGFSNARSAMVVSIRDKTNRSPLKHFVAVG